MTNAKRTTKPSKTKSAKAIEEAVKVQVPALTAEDAHNAIILLNRVQTRGMQEAALLVTLGQKLSAIKGNFEAPKNG